MFDGAGPSRPPSSWLQSFLVDFTVHIQVLCVQPPTVNSLKRFSYSKAESEGWHFRFSGSYSLIKLPDVTVWPLLII